MSKQALESVVSRAMEDNSFRQALLEDPRSACKGLDITDEEMEELAVALSVGFEGALQTRVSKSRFAGFSGPMGIDGIVE
jgi:hypothetical protein